MAFTRFHDDSARIEKQLQQSTDPGRWILNVPGNGESPCFIDDPHIRIQKWGANLRTNTINLESELRGINRNLNKDCLGINNYTTYNVPSESVQYPTCSDLTTGQSRATNPAWWYRDKEQSHQSFPQLNPQENTCLPFMNNLSTRILEKDYFTPKRESKINDATERLPTRNV